MFDIHDVYADSVQGWAYKGPVTARSARGVKGGRVFLCAKPQPFIYGT